MIDSPRHTPCILVVGPAWIGDMVMAQSLFMTLRQHNSDVAIDVLAPAWTGPLLERMPEVRRSIPMPLGHGQLQLKTRYRLGRGLRAAHYDRGIVLPNSFKSALAPYWARIPVRTGFRGELRWGLLNDMRHLDKRRLPMTVQRFVSLGLAVDTPLPPPVPAPRLDITPQNVAAALVRVGLGRPEGRLLVLCPGAEYGPAKRWPAEYYGRVARGKLDQGWSVWVFGSERDREVAAAVCAAAGDGCVNLAGRTALEDAIDLLSLADAVVSNDSGLMHVAAALNRPLVAVYGSSDPGFTPPLSDNAKIVSLGLECSPCFKRECPLGHLDCLRRLGPQEIEQAMEGLPH